MLSTPPSSRRPERLKRLCQALFGCQPEGLRGIGELRYQLFYGVAAALAYADQIEASRALFIIHEFVTTDTKSKGLDANESDLNTFLSLLAPEAVPLGRRLSGPFHVPGNRYIPGDVPLYLGKIRTETVKQG